MKNLLTEANHSIKSGKIGKSQYKRAAEFLKNSLSFYDKETELESKVGNAYEEFIFAFFELENARSGVDYLTLNLSSEVENSSTSGSKNLRSKLETGKKFEIYTVKEASSRDEDDTPVAKLSVYEFEKLKKSNNRRKKIIPENISKSETRLPNPNDFSLIIEKFKTPNHDGRDFNFNFKTEKTQKSEEKKKNETDEEVQKTLKKLFNGKKVIDVGNLVQNIYIDFKGNVNNLKLLNNESRSTIKNGSYGSLKEKFDDDRAKSPRESSHIKESREGKSEFCSPIKEDKSVSVSFVDIEKFSYHDRSSTENLFSRSRVSSIKESLYSEKFSSGKKKLRLSSKKGKFNNDNRRLFEDKKYVKPRKSVNVKNFLPWEIKKKSKKNFKKILSRKLLKKSRFQNELESNKIKILNSSILIPKENSPRVKIIKRKSKRGKLKPNEVLRSFIGKDRTSILRRSKMKKRVFIKEKKFEILNKTTGNISKSRREKKIQEIQIKKMKSLSNQRNRTLSTEKMKELEIELISTRNYVKKVRENLSILKKISSIEKKNFNKKSDFKLTTPIKSTEKKNTSSSLFKKILRLNSKSRGNSVLLNQTQTTPIKRNKSKKQTRTSKERKEGNKSSKYFLKKFSKFYKNLKKNRKEFTKSKNSSKDSILNFSIDSFKVNSKTITAISSRTNSGLKKNLRSQEMEKSLSEINPCLLQNDFFKRKKNSKNLRFFLRNRRKNIFDFEINEEIEVSRAQTERGMTYGNPNCDSSLGVERGKEGELAKKMINLIEEFGYSTHR